VPEAPLTPNEELLWRSLLRIVATLPRLLDDDLLRSTGVSLTEYVTLMNLSEAENEQMRLTDLANANGLSLSRISRIVEDLRARGLVTKRRASADTRGNIASLTAAGRKRLENAYPDHLLSARRRVMDHVDPAGLAETGQTLNTIAECMIDSSPTARPIEPTHG
jgi:DNA-binding MarR family transcriptional regulator